MSKTLFEHIFPPTIKNGYGTRPNRTITAGATRTSLVMRKTGMLHDTTFRDKVAQQLHEVKKERKANVTARARAVTT